MALHDSFASSGPIPAEVAGSLAGLTRTVVGAGGTVVVPHSSTLMSSETYLEGTVNRPSVSPSLGYGQHARKKGFYVMESPSRHTVETLTGLGATGTEIILAYVGREPVQGHPMIPTIQVTSEVADRRGAAEDFDLMLRDTPSSWAETLLGIILEVASRRYVPKLFAQGNVDFQITRGLLGMSI